MTLLCWSFGFLLYLLCLILLKTGIRVSLEQKILLYSRRNSLRFVCLESELFVFGLPIIRFRMPNLLILMVKRTKEDAGYQYHL